MKQECCNVNDVVDEFYNYLKAYISTKVKDKSVADDIVQEVMMKFVESHQKSIEIKNIKAWLFQVTRNTIFDYHKKYGNLFNLDQDEQLELEDQSDINFSEQVVKEYIIPMIKLLPEDYVIPLMLSDVENKPQKEIAETLGIGLSTTKMRIQRGRQKLRELFVKCCDITYDKNGNFVSCQIKHDCKTIDTNLHS